MYWRLPRPHFEAGKGPRNRAALRELVDRRPPGVLGYFEAQPAAWCAVAPRAEFIRLENSRLLKPVDEKPVWSISCLFVRRDVRKRGISTQIITAAALWAAGQGATAVEAYPTDAQKAQPDPFIWTGTRSAYAKAGFTEVARRSPNRPIMRWIPT
jgi:GNAT superfamily N-acetyltransferase